jgi:nicotinate-nucleotide pyrophosphorylase (carboxylating)
VLTDQQIRDWLNEDIQSGDITSQALIKDDKKTKAEFILKEEGVLCGIESIEKIFNVLDEKASIVLHTEDSILYEKGTKIATVEGNYKALLQAERTSLNLLQHLSGIATGTHKYVNQVKHTSAKIYDTRKTTPGFRELEKWAVRCGGGCNHRMGLYDQFLIKENHLQYYIKESNRFKAAIEDARQYKMNTKIIIEVENLEEFAQALQGEPDVILLDNMPPNDLRKAVALRDDNRAQTQCEASGGINIETITAVAESGVDRISVGAITHSAKNLDISLLIEN